MTVQQFVAASKAEMLIRSWRRRTFNVRDAAFGAKGDGVTDDTAAIQSAIDAAGYAGGGRVVLPYDGHPYLIAGPLRDVGGANAQLILPSVKYGLAGAGDPPVTITIEGEIPTPVMFSVMSTTVPPPATSTLLSTLTGPGSVIGAYRAGSMSNFTKVMADLRNFTVRMPPGAQGTAIDLSRVGQAIVAGVSVDTGEYSVFSVAEPYAGSFALRLPGQNNGALTLVESFGAIGMGTCVEVAEHTNVTGEITSYGCKLGVLSRTRGHTMRINRLNVHHQPHGVRVTNYQARMDIALYNNEPGGIGTWREQVADIDDPANLWWGAVRYGLTGIFVKVGGANVTATNIGSLIPA